MTRTIVSLRGKGPVIWLDSQSKDHPSSQVSYLAATPDVTVSFSQGEAHIHHPNGSELLRGDPFQLLKQVRAAYPGWYAGYFGYDLKNYTEDLQSRNPDKAGLPEMWFMRAQPQRMKRTSVTETLPYRVSRPESSVSEAQYKEQIAAIQQEIVEGEYYEVNLSHQLEAAFSGDPLGLYLDMRRAGPVPFGAYLAIGDVQVACASPERFISKNGNRVVSEPIKGTTRRGRTAEEDTRLRAELENSLKNRAENLMIVDLVRNDLNRVCVGGSVQVRDLFTIQSFGTVHQMVSTVHGTVRADIEAEDVLKSCFPMGSMTGAPKIRAMQAIEHYESYRRGLYSGAIGYITAEGDFSFNVVIRTAIIRDKRLYYSVGGAITSDSDPDAEWEETWIKAEALMAVL